MINKLDKRGKTTNEWDEIRALYDELLHWLYSREDTRKALPYAKKLARLLSKADPEHEAILTEECWSLIHETSGDLKNAIKHREMEIKKIRRLHAISRGQPHETAATEGYGISDLSDRLNLLATLYYDKGDFNKAVSLLSESKRLCADHKVSFGGEDLLREYSKEINPLDRRRHHDNGR
jgi:tetratricopeptide (TPR) repeat protein